MEREYRGQNPRGSEVTTEDSQRKEIAEISDLGVQKAPSTESGTANAEISDLGVQNAPSTESGTANAKISELGVQGALSVLENVAGFKPMNVNTGEVTYSDVVVWLMTMQLCNKAKMICAI